MTMEIDSPDVENDTLTRTKTHILAKLNGKELGKVTNLDWEQNEIEKLLESSITSNEGNSCLIIGPRSTGKTTLVETTIKSLQTKYPDQFITIHLSGFAQSEDKMALREITHQLDRILDEGVDSTSEETIAMAVAAGEYTGFEQRSISDTLRALLSSFEHANAESMSVIFILEEFDRFTLYPRQTLLYNLLDLCQTAKVGIAVVGITARMNTREMLEKRVRSRFSQRLYTIKRPNTVELFWSICAANLFIDDSSIPADFADEWNTFLGVCASGGRALPGPVAPRFARSLLTR